MNLQDQQDRLWLTQGQKPTSDKMLLDPFAFYGFVKEPNTSKLGHRRVKSAQAARSYSNDEIKNRNHPPGYQTPDFHIGKAPHPSPATSRPTSSRSGHSSVRHKNIKINQSSPTSLFLSTQRIRCKSAPPVKPDVYIPKRPQTANSRSRASSARGAPQRAWEMRTNLQENHRSLLSSKEIQYRQKTRCKSAPLPYNFSDVDLINDVSRDCTDYERLLAMTKPFSCMPELVKNAVNHNGLRHCCSAYNTGSNVPHETRKQFWPISRPGVYRRGFVPQYFSFVKPVQPSGSTPTITYTKPTDEDITPVHQEEWDDSVLFEETFDYPATPSELSLSDQYDLSDNDADIMDDVNVREYLESRLADPDDEDDLRLSRLSPEPIDNQLNEVEPEPQPVAVLETLIEDNQIPTPEIDVEIIITQAKPNLIPEPENVQDQDKNEPESTTLNEPCTIEMPREEEPETVELDQQELDIEQTDKITDVQEEKAVKPNMPSHPEPPKVTFVDSITVTSYKPAEKKSEPPKTILKQPKAPPPIQPQPPMEQKPTILKKPKPRPLVERREADIKPQIKPGIVLKPEPPKEEKEEEENKEEEKEETKPLEEKLPEPEFVPAPGAYRMYQPVNLNYREQAQAKSKNKIHSRTSQMPFTGGHHQLFPESSQVVNAVMEDERRKKEGTKPWLQGRLALSKQTSRFELPMDVKVLESITAMDYLTKYCIISTRRKALFKHIFQRVDKDRDGIIGFRELEKGLKEIHVDSIDVKQVRNIVEMVGADDKTKFNLKQFSAIAAFSERILFSNFVTEETKGINSSKEIIEEADFCSLKWKLDGFNVNPTVRRLLEAL